MNEDNHQKSSDGGAYEKPVLVKYGTLMQTTKTDPASTMGDDISAAIMAWGDPS